MEKGRKTYVKKYKIITLNKGAFLYMLNRDYFQQYYRPKFTLTDLFGYEKITGIGDKDTKECICFVLLNELILVVPNVVTNEKFLEFLKNYFASSSKRSVLFILGKFYKFQEISQNREENIG